MDNIVTITSPIEEHMLHDGALILIDKPLTWTSFDVVNKLRYSLKHHLGLRKYKVGHAGTLDPLATGLLLICISRYTKKIEELMAFDKAYTGIIQLGRTTPSYDGESQPDMYFPDVEINEDKLRSVETHFHGSGWQYPPIYSAIKVKGTPLYKLARRGKTVQLEKRPITLSELHLKKKSNDLVYLEVRCSKGTYIRSLANDIGKFLGTGGYLAELRRTSIGSFSVQNALTIDHFVQQLDQLN